MLYKLEGHILDRVHLLGVTLSSDLKWASYVAMSLVYNAKQTLGSYQKELRHTQLSERTLDTPPKSVKLDYTVPQ